jgi:SAM-dependent methyltransferase
MEKEQLWKGYYNYYLAEANRKGVNPVAILDERWFDGRTLAETCVLPYICQNSVVLEIACGIGRVSRFVWPRCKDLYCVDILEEALVEIKKTLRNSPNVYYQKTSGYDLSSFNADFFDCVYSFATFFHFDFELVVNYFCEIKRILKPGGIGIIEFKRWVDKQDVIQLLEKIEHRGGIKRYEAEIDKWRYVSKEMLEILCDFYDLTVIDDDVTNYTFRKRDYNSTFLE